MPTKFDGVTINIQIILKCTSSLDENDVTYKKPKQIQ